MLLPSALGSCRSEQAFHLTLDVQKHSPGHRLPLRNTIANMSHLEELPQELFDLVITQLHPSDLPNLRLTSRTCAAKVLDRYAIVHFRDCSVNCDARKDDLDDNLAIFLRIAQNKTIGSKMQSLILEFKADSKDTAVGSDSFDHTITTQLKTLFAALTQHRHLKKICITSELGLDGDDLEALSQQTRPLRLVLNGLKGHHLEVNDLVLGRDRDYNNYFQWSLPYHKLLDAPAQCKAFRSVLQKLTSLRISLWEKEEPRDRSEVMQQRGFDFMNMLSKAPRLKTLALYDSHHHEAFLCDFNCFKKQDEAGFPALETLELDHVFLSLGGMVEFANTYLLTTLILSNVRFFGFGALADAGYEINYDESPSLHFEAWTNLRMLVDTDSMTRENWRYAEADSW